MQSLDAIRKLSVLDRERIEHVVRSILDLRARDDYDAMAEFYADNIVFEIVGDPRSFVYAGQYFGREAAVECTRRMYVEIEYLGYELLDLLIDHDRAIMRRRVHVRHRGTGVCLRHEVWDRFRFEDGMISEAVKFLDVDAFHRLQGGS